VVHPHHAAVDRCDECLEPFCGECFVRDGERLLCHGCWAAAPLRVAEAARRGRWQHRLTVALHERRASLAAGAIIVGLLGGGAALAAWDARTGGSGGSAIAQALADEPAVLQRASAERYCAVGQGTSGGVPTPVSGPATPSSAGSVGPPQVPANPVSTAPTGALVATVAGVLPDTLLQDDRLAGTPVATSPYDPMNLALYRGSYAASLPGWRSQTGLFPQMIGYELGGTVTVDRVAFQQASRLPPESWAKDVGLLLSTEAPDAGFYQVGRWSLVQTLDPQEFTFVETPARYARVCLYANYGGREYVSLGALVLGVMPPPSLMDTQNKPLLPRAR
jgi:hypothetical protein